MFNLLGDVNAEVYKKKQLIAEEEDRLKEINREIEELEKENEEYKAKLKHLEEVEKMTAAEYENALKAKASMESEIIEKEKEEREKAEKVEKKKRQMLQIEENVLKQFEDFKARMAEERRVFAPNDPNAFKEDENEVYVFVAKQMAAVAEMRAYFENKEREEGEKSDNEQEQVPPAKETLVPEMPSAPQSHPTSSSKAIEVIEMDKGTGNNENYVQNPQAKMNQPLQVQMEETTFRRPLTPVKQPMANAKVLPTPQQLQKIQEPLPRKTSPVKMTQRSHAMEYDLTSSSATFAEPIESGIDKILNEKMSISGYKGMKEKETGNGGEQFQKENVNYSQKSQNSDVSEYSTTSSGAVGGQSGFSSFNFGFTTSSGNDENNGGGGFDLFGSNGNDEGKSGGGEEEPFFHWGSTNLF